MSDTKLQELQTLITLLNRNISKEDFEKNFRILIELVKELKIANRKEMDFLGIKYDSVVNSIKEGSEKDVAAIKQKVWDYCLTEIGKMVDGYKRKETEIDKKIAGVRDGKDADETIIVSKASTMAVEALKPDLLTIGQVEDNLSKQGDLIADTLEALPDKKKLEIEAIKDLRKELDELKKEKGGRIFGGGGFSLLAMQQHFIDDETPTGLVNGVNTDFVIGHTPNPVDSLKVFVNGQRLRLTEDYTFSGLTITFLTAPPTGSIILCDYRI